ncbi:hypothetical protein F3Y22_tig00109916pilonHSYRG00111 [Hibiscus syriacus]|uniref:Reverse transcriptase Ty1/copia-type domain-containing protein n=1 Tax=Hibiscus syriacus TaxID=106335 RepID=A0A6A3BYX9_HIBSY|nr:hypothetical protein F3Y22_tig00109916pilonHSYRG00111 [Hibiscus syriacus]
MVESLNDSFDNGANSYYLHQSENPGMILVSQLLFNDNFHSWKRSMILALSAKNKLGFVDSSIQAPDPSMVNQFNAWTRANNLVNSWLLNSVSKDIAASLLYHTTTAEIWKDLLCSCLQCNYGGVQRMLAEHQQEQVIQFLMRLNESYDHIRGQILLMGPLPPISKVFSLIVQEENQRNIQSSHPISEPTFSIKSRLGTNARKNRPLCSHCNLLGHTKGRCYKLIGYPPSYNSKNWSSSTSSRGKSSQAIHTNSVVSQQISPTVSEAFTPEQCQQLIAMLTSQLQSASSLDIPATSINTAMQVIGKGELAQGLYLLQMSLFRSNISCNNVSSSLSSDWHNRLGHPSLHVMHLLMDVLLLKNVKMKESCKVCPLSKQQRSDNALELKFTELFTNLGIMHQFSCVETPQQNSIVERKHQVEGSIDRCKARLVAKGFTQVEGMDTFSPVAKMTSFQVILSLAVTHNWHLLQLDVNNAFLNGTLDEEVYMKLPLGYKSELKGSNMVCKLHKYIYSLKQASRQWFTAFSNIVIQLGFQQSPFEHSLFTRGCGSEFIALLVYVDDIVLTGEDLQAFYPRGVGALRYFLGFEIARNSSGIILS